MGRRLTKRDFLGAAAVASGFACNAGRAAVIGRAWPLQTTILSARVRFQPQTFLHPLIISSGKITEITEAQVEVRVRVDGREAVGKGSIYLSDLWAWPDPRLTHERRDAELRSLCRQIEGNLWALCGGEPAHPLELGLRLHDAVSRQKTPPVLARAMCASPFDAALHDAVGIAMGRSAFDFYRDPTPLPSADPFFPSRNAAAAITRLIRPPQRALRAWYLAGKAEMGLSPLSHDGGPL